MDRKNLFTKSEFKDFLASKGISYNDEELEEILRQNKGEFPEDGFDLNLKIGKSESQEKLRVQVDNTTLTILGQDDFEIDSPVLGKNATLGFDYTIDDFDFQWIEYLMETPHENQEEYLEFIEKYFDDVREYAGMDIDYLDEDDEDYDVLLSGYLDDVSVSTKMIDRARELRKSLAKSK